MSVDCVPVVQNAITMNESRSRTGTKRYRDSVAEVDEGANMRPDCGRVEEWMTVD